MAQCQKKESIYKDAATQVKRVSIMVLCYKNESIHYDTVS